MIDQIVVRGAREHNLQNIEITLPRNALVVFTGVSGSGKSSLAFDTIYAEGQRRYVESLSAYARQFLEMMQKPDVDSIEGLSPAISIEQKTASRNPRSTVGTVTEIYDYLRLLFARIGVPHSPTTGLPIESQTISQMVDRIMNLGEGMRIFVLAPIVRERKGEYRKELKDLQKKGFQRVKIDGEHYEIDNIPALKKTIKHTIEVVVDRLVIHKEIGNRLPDSIQIALELADEILVIENADNGNRQIFSAKFACPVSGFTIDEIEPRLFSFNSPAGACPKCDGLGHSSVFDPDLVISDSSKTLNQSVITPWAGSSSPYYAQTIKSLARAYKISLNTPFQELEKNIQDAFLWGSGEKIIRMTYSDGENKYSIERPFEGVIPNMERRYRETSSSWVRDELARFQSPTDCQTCNGMRLKPESLAVKIADLNISLLTKKSISEARNWIENLPIFLSETQNEIASRILKEINERLQFLIDVGLEYLTLSRSSRTLSGGESQRIRLASQIGSGLTGVLYVLDEPSIGLHQRDNTRLLDTLRRLRDLGNTVVVVEHDEEAIRCADFLVDLGPGAGAKGGKIIASGSPKKILKNKESLTARYLRGELEIKIPIERKKGNGKKITLKSATANNLNNIDVDFPLGTFTCITGVSGSGKSTLVLDTLYKILARKLHNAREVPGTHIGISGIEFIDKVVDIDQSPIGRTPRSNPATYTGTFTPIREWYSGLPEARARGYKPGRFSFNVKGGRCEACQGDGVIKIEMHFLPDVYVKCDVCKGSRYNRETLEILFKKNTISDVLNMSVDEGHEFFKAVPSIREKLSMLKRVGLGYIQIGQQATTLSGGEAQRIKLSKELARRATGKTLYILDEPTTGLHFEDIKNLLNVLHALVEQGNTVIVIEHNLEVIKTADWIIDLGPDGGNKGGKIIAIGTPEEVSKHSVSYTGQYLATYFNDKSKKQLQKVF